MPDDIGNRPHSAAAGGAPDRSGKDAEKEELRRALHRLRGHSRERRRELLKPIHFRRDLPRPSPAPPTPLSAARGPSVVLEDAVEGSEVRAATGGAAFLVETRHARDSQQGAGLHDPFRQAVAARGATPGDVLLLDLETTGLASTPVFLIGTMECDEDGFVARQFLARNYAEEAAIISLFAARLAGKALLVTFNGKTFDCLTCA